MGQRLDLQAILSNIPGVVKAYFQPPGKNDMKYPCIVYERSKNKSKYANNRRYASMRMYSVTVIDANPDTAIATHVEALPYCDFDRHYVADNLHHYSYRLYF